MNTPKTINYYNTNAKTFAEGTIAVDFSDMQKRFTDKLQEHARILDFGCGAGRDAKAFLERGFWVEAIDGSKELCKIASQYAGITVTHMYFEDLCVVETYDGIWACASILHLPKKQLLIVLKKMCDALKKNGIIYTSFKYGTFEGERNGRYFTDMTEASFGEIIGGIRNLEIEELWTTSDVRPGRGEEKWLNLILRKA